MLLSHQTIRIWNMLAQQVTLLPLQFLGMGQHQGFQIEKK